MNYPISLGYGTIGDVDLMTDSLFGFEALAGGIDSLNVQVPAHTMTASSSLVMEGLAKRAASYAVERDFQAPGAAQLLTKATLGAPEATVRAQLVDLFRRFYGLSVTSESDDVTAAYELYQGVISRGGDEKHAWKTTLVALLEDPRLTYY